ncbi:hypothetical protein ACIRRA_39720 [Nocardia sp. NPDC101769]|uniref:hypothetical protein n=1 Tax=Nocardia sp. NPDC101769 TaxID=3364333 RepID=UPI00382C887C
MTTLSHPAVDLALSEFSGGGRAARLVAAIDRNDTMAVLVATDSPFDGDTEARVLVFVEWDGTEWRLPGVMNGSTFRHTTRAITTGPGRPLDSKRTKLYRKDNSEIGWFGLTGYAAEDAVAVTVASSLGTDHVEVAADGLVLAAVRARFGEDPEKPVVVIHLADGTNIVDPR